MAGRSWSADHGAPAFLPGFPRGTERSVVNRALRGAPKEAAMLWTVFVVLLVLWLLGMVTSYTLGGFIHILLLIALAVVLIRLIQGRRPVV
jgi:hypothetical protein